MKDPLSTALEEALTRLQHATERLNSLADLDGLAAAHFDKESRLERDLGWHVYCEPVIWLHQSAVDLREAPQLAVLGFLLSEEVRRTGRAASEAIDAFKSHAALLKLRLNAFSLPNSWVLQPHVLLGVSLGIAATKDSSLMSWLGSLVEEGCVRADNPLFLQLIYSYLSVIVGTGLKPENTIPARMDLVQYSVPELALAIWLVKHDLLRSAHEDRANWLREACSTLVEGLVTQPPYEAEDFKAAIIWEVATGYLDKWSRALVYLSEHLVIGEDSNTLILRDSLGNDDARAEEERKLSQVTRERAFFMRVSVWFACIITVLGVSLWLPSSLALWLSCAVAIVGLAVVIFLPWYFESSWFANPARRFALYLVGTASVLATSWAILDPSNRVYPLSRQLRGQ